ncbi:MAG: hypothetical protein ACF787_04260, partial [Rhodopirellula sp. JB053]
LELIEENVTDKPQTTDAALYELHCPMAFEGRGASWIQSDVAVRNPYYGPSMLKCADKVEKL